MILAQRLALLAVAGALGTLARYSISLLAARMLGNAFPWGTLTVNLLGCLLFGFIWTLAVDRQLIGDETRLILLTGFMGALTTFSTFAFETGDALRRGQTGLAAGNLLAQNTLGLAAVLAGMALARWSARP